MQGDRPAPAAAPGNCGSASSLDNICDCSVAAHTHAEDIARSLEAGSDMHLGKPIHPAALIAAVQSVFANAADRCVLVGDLHLRSA